MIFKSAATKSGVSPPPKCAPAKKIPSAVPRSAAGNQRESVFETLGNAPASPIPKRNRRATSETKLNAAAVKIVKLDHQMTILVRTRLDPIRSPQAPVGISKSA